MQLRREVLPRPARSVSRRTRSKAAAAKKRGVLSREALRARRKFLRVFPGGFRDGDYLDLERGYKWNAHRRWEEALGESAFEGLIKKKKFEQIAAAAIRIESRTNLLFSFEKMALRDAVRSPAGAKAFALALFDLLHGADPVEVRFGNWVEAIARLPRRKTRVLTWPLVTVFGFIAQPNTHFFLKPTVTREAAWRYGVELPYASRPSWPLYKDLLAFVRRVRSDIGDLRPRDMIDMQSFLWVQGSDEYPD
ncbi:hypothetical protein [Bradyrhizobium sp.]|uniref:hypothetical protein n=1 Tax=Bradyrhizobium sp. TaxID=376 RepID=UPI002DF85ACE|nr:hypothetical protein [Bradyrhizobium sp.]